MTPGGPKGTVFGLGSGTQIFRMKNGGVEITIYTLVFFPPASNSDHQDSYMFKLRASELNRLIYTTQL